MTFNFKKLIPHAIAVVSFIIITFKLTKTSRNTSGVFWNRQIRETERERGEESGKVCEYGLKI